MKIYFIALVGFLLSTQAFAASTCGAIEFGKAAATIDMEIDLLNSGLYNIVRNEAMLQITSIVRNHIASAQTCDTQTYNLQLSTLKTIDDLVMKNPNPAPYTISTANRIYSTFSNLVSVLSNSSQDYLASLLKRGSLESRTCGAFEIGQAVATIDMEINLLNSGLYNVVRNEAMTHITGIVRNHLMQAKVCDNQSYDLLVNTIKTIDDLVMTNPNPAPYSIGTANRIYSTFSNLTSVLENSSAMHLESLIRSN